MKEVDPLKHFGTFPTIAQADVCQRGTQTLTPRTWNIHGLKIFNDTISHKLPSPVVGLDQIILKRLGIVGILVYSLIAVLVFHLLTKNKQDKLSFAHIYYIFII